jgi:hypothetical protein
LQASVDAFLVLFLEAIWLVNTEQLAKINTTYFFFEAEGNVGLLNRRNRIGICKTEHVFIWLLFLAGQCEGFVFI